MSTIDISQVQRKASIGGAQFHVDTTSENYGRRVITHEFPLRDTAFLEEMGRKTTQIQIEGYLIGANWLAERDALISANRSKRNVTLVHPFYGRPKSVRFTDLSVSHSKDELGRVKVTLTLLEVNSSFPSFSLGFLSSALEVSIDFTIGAAITAFDDNVIKTEKIAAAGTQQCIEDAAVVIDEARLLSSVSSDYAPNLDLGISNLFDNAGEISRGERALSDSITPIIDNWRLGAADSLQDNARSLRSIREFGLDYVPSIYSAQTYQNADSNYTRTAATFRRIFGSLQGEFASGVDWTTRADAVEAQNTYAVWSDTELSLIPTDLGSELYEIFDRSRGSTIDLFSIKDTDLSPSIDITLPGPSTALAVATRLYGDPERAIELWQKSGSPHPSWLQPNLTVEAR